MLSFSYDLALLNRYPTTTGGIILSRNLRNGPTPPDLQEAYRAEQQAVLTRLGNTPLSQLASLSAWRGVFSSFGVEPTKYRSAAEALLRRLTKKGDIPSINTLVDIGNLVSIRYGLPVAIFDGRDVTGMVTVRFAEGSERFTPLGESVVEHPEPSEVIFADDTGMVLARRWCWRQSEESAARETTSSAIITVEAHHSGARFDIERALAELAELVQKYAGGESSNGVLDTTRTEISA